MKRILPLAEYWKRGIVKSIRPDKSKMRQMQKMANIREDFLGEPLDEKFIALRLEAYHDIISELLTAHLYKEGVSCRTRDSLLAYAFRHFPLCDKYRKQLIELFTLRSKIHSSTPVKIKKFLEKNEMPLLKIIAELK